MNEKKKLLILFSDCHCILELSAMELTGMELTGAMELNGMELSENEGIFELTVNRGHIVTKK